jgi:hypothetical protein
MMTRRFNRPTRGPRVSPLPPTFEPAADDPTEKMSAAEPIEARGKGDAYVRTSAKAEGRAPR